MFENDQRIIMTLDAGGTNFVFSAMQHGEQIAQEVHLPSVPNSQMGCLEQLVKGFRQVEKQVVEQLKKRPAAISFAFPGPADYLHGVIGDLPNFPAFRGGVAMGAYLEKEFELPVYINNDGNLYAYGEALFGALPQVNSLLKQGGSSRRYRNLIGVTFGTGFGCGVVINKTLLRGDNGCGGDLWLMRNGHNPRMIAEENVSVRGVKRVYEEFSGECANNLSPKDIFDIAEGCKAGNQNAARKSFFRMGEVAGDALVTALNLVDGLVVIGGGLAGAAKYILPGVMSMTNSTLLTYAGDEFPCLQSEAYNLEDEDDLKAFLRDDDQRVKVPASDSEVEYIQHRKVGILTSRLGASRAVALGAYAFALNQLDEE